MLDAGTDLKNKEKNKTRSGQDIDLREGKTVSAIPPPATQGTSVENRSWRDARIAHRQGRDRGMKNGRGKHFVWSGYQAGGKANSAVDRGGVFYLY